MSQLEKDIEIIIQDRVDSEKECFLFYLHEADIFSPEHFWEYCFALENIINTLGSKALLNAQLVQNVFRMLNYFKTRLVFYYRHDMETIKGIKEDRICDYLSAIDDVTRFFFMYDDFHSGTCELEMSVYDEVLTECKKYRKLLR